MVFSSALPAQAMVVCVDHHGHTSLQVGDLAPGAHYDAAHEHAQHHGHEHEGHEHEGHDHDRHEHADDSARAERHPHSVVSHDHHGACDHHHDSHEAHRHTLTVDGEHPVWSHDHHDAACVDRAFDAAARLGIDRHLVFAPAPRRVETMGVPTASSRVVIGTYDARAGPAHPVHLRFTILVV